MKCNIGVLLLGSNIHPEENIPKALDLLCNQAQIRKRSQIWKTKAVGSKGPDFLNIAVEIQSSKNANQIKNMIIKPIEKVLGRIRSGDKFAPRTIDIDIILFNNQIVDSNLWVKIFIALPVSELLPELLNETTGKTLLETVKELKSSAFAELYIA